MKKEHFINALKCRNSPHEIPFWELEFHLWNQYSSKKFIIGSEFTRLSKKEKGKAISTNCEIMEEVIELLGFSALSVPGTYSELTQGVPAYFWLPDYYREQQVKVLQRRLSKKTALVVHVGGIMSLPAPGENDDFLIQMLKNPGQANMQARLMLENAKVQIRTYRNMGIELFLSSSDLAKKSVLHFPQEQFNRFILPYIDEWSAFIKAQGGYSILHTDGNIESCIDQISLTSLDAIHAHNPTSGGDTVEIQKRAAGKLCLCGIMDCHLVSSESEDTIHTLALELLEKHASIPGCSFGMSNVLGASISKAGFDAVVRAYREWTGSKKV